MEQQNNSGTLQLDESQKMELDDSQQMQLDEWQTAESQQILAEDLVDAIQPRHIEAFVDDFAAYRKAEKLSQREVAIAMNLSQTTICRFEKRNLSYRNMCKMMHATSQWILDRNRGAVVVPKSSSPTQHRNRRRRSSFSADQKQILMSMFDKSPYVDDERVDSIAVDTGLEHRVVYNWFRNRRQSLIKMMSMQQAGDDFDAPTKVEDQPSS